MGWICYSRVWISHEGRIVLLFIQRCILWCRVNLSMRNVAGCLFAGQLTTRDAGPHLQVQWKGKSWKRKKEINGIKSQEKCHSWKQTQVNYVSSSNWELRIDYSVVSLNGSVQKTFWKHFGKVPLKVEHVGRKLMGRTEIRIKLGELSTFWQKQKPGKVWKLLGRTRIKIKQKCRRAVKTFKAKWGAE